MTTSIITTLSLFRHHTEQELQYDYNTRMQGLKAFGCTINIEYDIIVLLAGEGQNGGKYYDE